MINQNTLFFPNKINEDYKKSKENFKFIRDEFTTEELDKNPNFENQTPQSIINLIQLEIRKSIDVITLENITESHASVLIQLWKSQFVKHHNNTNLIKNFDECEFVYPICFWNDQILYKLVVELLMDFKTDRTVESVEIDRQ